MRRRLELEERLAVVQQEYDRQTTQERRARWLLVAVPVISIAAGSVWGRGAAIAAALYGLLLTVVAYYLIWTHRQDCESRRTGIRGQISVGDRRAAGEPEPERPRWQSTGKPTQLFD